MLPWYDVERSQVSPAMSHVFLWEVSWTSGGISFTEFKDAILINQCFPTTFSTAMHVRQDPTSNTNVLRLVLPSHYSHVE